MKPALERLEARDLLATFSFQLPAGGPFSVVAADQLLQVRDNGYPIFSKPVADVSLLQLTGTAGGDALRVALPANLSARLTLAIDGGGGHDSVAVRVPAGPVSAVLSPGGGRINAPNLTVTLAGVENISVQADAGKNIATLLGSHGADTLSATTGQFATLAAAGQYTNQVQGFATVVAQGLGGKDQAAVVDSAKNDTAFIKVGNAYLAANDASASVRAVGFASVVFRAGHGKDDGIALFDSPGADTAAIGPGAASVSASDGTYTALARGFRRVRIDATRGGKDSLTVNEAAGADRFVFKPNDWSTFGNTSHTIDWRFLGFENVRANADGKQGDLATLFDGPGIDTFFGPDTKAPVGQWTNARRTYYLKIVGFNRVNVAANRHELNILNTLPQFSHGFTLSTSGLVPIAQYYAGLVPGAGAESTFSLVHLRDYGGIPSHSAALVMLRRLVESQNSKLAHAANRWQLALLLRDQIHHEVVNGKNSPYWGSLDPYHRYLIAMVRHEERLRCGGVSLVFRDVLEAFGFKARLVNLYAADGINGHSSTEVRLDGRWIAIDATYDITYQARTGRYLNYAQIFQHVPYTITHNGFTPQPNLRWEDAPIPFRNYFHKLEYPAG